MQQNNEKLPLRDKKLQQMSDLCQFYALLCLEDTKSLVSEGHLPRSSFQEYWGPEAPQSVSKLGSKTWALPLHSMHIPEAGLPGLKEGKL